MQNIFDITDFGAVADGKTDCTVAIQNAIDEAEKVKGVVIVPPGKFLCGEIFMKPSVSLMGYRGWGYRETGGSVLILNDKNAYCMINMTNAFAASVQGLQLLGNHVLGENIHGISADWKEYDSRRNYPLELEDNVLPEETQIGFREDSTLISDCQIKNFSGDAVHYENIWAFTIRDSMFIANKGNAIYIKGWDGWIYNCVMHTNHGAAIYSDVNCASLTVAENRIEWNRNGGINLRNSNAISITGNFFDRSYGPAIKIIGNEFPSNSMTIVGNIFRRSGKHDSEYENKYLNSHIYLEKCASIATSSNTFAVGRDDRGCGEVTPDYGIVLKDVRNCVVSANVQENGSLVENIVVLGNNENLMVGENVGSLGQKDK